MSGEARPGLDPNRASHRARWGARRLADLVDAGVLVAHEAERMSAASDLLWRVRNIREPRF